MLGGQKFAHPWTLPNIAQSFSSLQHTSMPLNTHTVRMPMTGQCCFLFFGMMGSSLGDVHRGLYTPVCNPRCTTPVVFPRDAVACAESNQAKGAAA